MASSTTSRVTGASATGLPSASLTSTSSAASEPGSTGSAARFRSTSSSRARGGDGQVGRPGGHCRQWVAGIGTGQEHLHMQIRIVTVRDRNLQHGLIHLDGQRLGLHNAGPIGDVQAVGRGERRNHHHPAQCRRADRSPGPAPVEPPPAGQFPGTVRSQTPIAQGVSGSGDPVSPVR